MGTLRESHLKVASVGDGLMRGKDGDAFLEKQVPGFAWAWERN